MKLKALFTSRRFIVAIVGVITVFTQDTIPPETLQYLVGLAMAWIVGDSLRETV